MKKILLTPLAALCLYWSGAASSADFVVVRIEAEDFTSKSDRWVLTSPTTTPGDEADPDPAHNDTASGQANLELLPDTRVTHEDDVANGGLDGNFWGGPGGGPRIDYNIDIPEPGRYFLYVKSYSTGTEDNGLHVGINDTLPESGKRIQICSKHNWQWTSGQRTDDNHCGVTKTIWLDVLAAGTNTITFFAREDGFEIDQFLLLKETHDGSLNCFPNYGDEIRCTNLTTGQSFDTPMAFSQSVGGDTVANPTGVTLDALLVTQVDVDLEITTIGTSHFVDDTVEYRVTVTNNDDLNTATNTIASIDLPAGLQFTGSSACTESSSKVICDFDNLAANSTNTLSFFTQVQAEGSHRVDAQVNFYESDDNSSNNTDSATISAAYQIPDFEASLALQQNSNVSSVGGQTLYTAVVTNNGLQEINGASLQINLDSGLTLDSTQGCDVTCAVPSIAANQSVELNFYTTADVGGDHTVNVQLLFADDTDESNNTASLTETVKDSVIVTSDNGQVVIEAESFNSVSPASTSDAPQWLLINSAFTALDSTIDPDQASPVGTSGDAYMELLPDTRIDANGARIENVTNFNSGGVGATMSYSVFFYEAGTYNVLARVRPNNTEDATLHIGLDNEWPETSSSISVCNPDGTWQWTSNLKLDTGCSTTTAATINVDKPGLHVVMVSQDTDGLELDKIILSKDQVTDLTGTGPAPTAFDTTASADIALTASVSNETVAVDEAVELVVSLINNSTTHESVGLAVRFEGLSEQLDSTVFDSCTTTDGEAVCYLDKLGATQEVTETFNIIISDASSLTIKASVTAALADSNPLNNWGEVNLTIDNDSLGNKSTDDSSKKSSGGGSISLAFLMLLLLPFGAAHKTKRQPIAAGNTQQRNSKSHS